jgi:N-methylhydantoinase B/oxoprolinase/acetone carboxylase alpha subunit
MSGGSMNYLYSKLDYDATFHTNTPERRAFKEHLVKVSKALHDIEWVDSGDYRTGDENAAIRACLSSEQLLESVIEQAEEALQNLREELERVKA